MPSGRVPGMYLRKFATAMHCQRKSVAGFRSACARWKRSKAGQIVTHLPSFALWDDLYDVSARCVCTFAAWDTRTDNLSANAPLSDGLRGCILRMEPFASNNRRADHESLPVLAYCIAAGPRRDTASLLNGPPSIKTSSLCISRAPGFVEKVVY